MKPIHAKLPGWLLLLMLAGAFFPGCLHYEAMPLDAAASLDALSGRSLSDPGLREFIEANMDQAPDRWPLSSWNFHTLTLAALYFNPDLEVARAKLAEAEAARITAGERPNPVIGLTPAYNVSTPSGLGISPWILGINFDFPLEIAGKRNLRLSEGLHLSDAARMELAGAAWKIRSDVRKAMVDLWAAEKGRTLYRQKLAVASALARIMEARYEAGDVDRNELMSARLLEQQARFESEAAAGAAETALIHLAVSTGLASHGLEGVEIDLSAFETIPEEIPTADARKTALLNRADILGALSAYAASETALRLEIARQYPDIDLGPAYEYDQGEDKWGIGFQLTLPVLSRNRGPIAEAEAKRKTAAVEFTALQSTVLGEIESAAVAFRAGRRQVAAAEEMFEQARQQAGVVERQYSAGAVSRQEALSSKLEEISADSIRLESLAAAQTSLGELEYALQTPLDATTLPANISSEEK